MSLLDIDEIIEDRNIEIKQWLKANCSIRGIEFIIHDGVVDIKAKSKGYINRYVHFHMLDEYFPTDLFKFGICEIEQTDDLFGFGKPIINISLGRCPNLKSLNGLPDNIKSLGIYDCPKLENLNNIPINITSIFLHTHQFKYKQELLTSIQQYSNHKLLIL